MTHAAAVLNPTTTRAPRPRVRVMPAANTSLALAPIGDLATTTDLRIHSRIAEAPKPKVGVHEVSDCEPRLPIRFRSSNGEPGFNRKATSSADLPPVRMWAGQFVVAYLQILNRKRRIQHLDKWMNLRQMNQVRVDVQNRNSANCDKVDLISLHLREAIDGVVEASCVVKEKGRYKAMTLRFEGWDSRWICTHARIL